jgi:outer membrane protein assembly factor BamB
MLQSLWRSIALTLIALPSTAALLAAEEFKSDAVWPQFLGPRRDGIVREMGVNVDWKNKPPKTLWKQPIGNGFSSVIIVGDRLYTQANRGERDGVICLDAVTGKELWFYDAVPSYIDVQRHGPGPRSTPTYHDGKLYCLFAMGELYCLTPDGKKLWQADMFKDTGAKNPAGQTYYWGVSMSPLVESDLVIVQPGGDKGNSVAAYHKDTGKLVWTAGDDPVGYASPITITVAGKKQVVVPTGQSFLGIDPAKGQVLWRYALGNQFNATCATPVWSDNVLFLSAAYGAGSAVIEIMPPSEVEQNWTVREKWKNKRNLQNLMATSMVIDGHIYGCHGDLSAFFLRCLDLKTGDIKWEQRVERRHGLLAVEGHLLCMNERGPLLLLTAQPNKYEVKGELGSLLDKKDRAWAALAFANGKLYIRDDRHVRCLDLRR